MPQLVNATFVFPLRLGRQKSQFIFPFDDSLCSIQVQPGIGRRLYRFHSDDALPRAGAAPRRYEVRAQISGFGEQPLRKLTVSSGSFPYIETIEDHIGYSQIDVAFEAPAEEPVSDQRAEELRDMAFERLQHFIKSYQFITRETDVFVPLSSDSSAAEISIAVDYKVASTGVHGDFKPISTSLRWPSAKALGLVKSSVRGGWEDALNDLLQSKSGPSVEFQLMFEAKRLRDAQIHPISAVILQTAFEVFLQNRMMEECSIRGIKELNIGRRREPARDLIETGNICGRLLSQYVPQICGVTVNDSQEHFAWHRHAYTIRNQIVHRGRDSLAAAEVDNAYRVTAEYRTYLDLALKTGRS